jgi:hypothetical protein
MAGSAIGWHKITAGPRKGTSIFVPKKVAWVLGVSQAEIAAILGGKVAAVGIEQIISRVRSQQPAGVAKASMSATQAEQAVRAALAGMGSDFKVSVKYPTSHRSAGTEASQKGQGMRLYQLMPIAPQNGV